MQSVITESPAIIGEIVSVEDCEDGFYIGFQYVSHFDNTLRTLYDWIKKSERLGFVPLIGDSIKQYSDDKHFALGSRIRGMVIRDEIIFYRTPEEEEAHQQKLHEEYIVSQKNEFSRNKEKLDRDFESLPAIFQDRIRKFRLTNPDFRWQHESYEMMCCTQAMVLVEALKTVEAIDAWNELSYEKQMMAVPLFSDQHSGNSASAAVYLAKCYLTDPDLVFAAHGALTSLTGCDDYGCPHGEKLEQLLSNNHFDAISPNLLEKLHVTNSKEN